jgi:hypothetical protein
MTAEEEKNKRKKTLRWSKKGRKKNTSRRKEKEKCKGRRKRI